MRKLPLILVVSLMAFGCASTRTTSTTTGTGKYTEDLSVWRPETTKVIDSVKTTTPERIRKNEYVPAKFAVNAEVDTILDSIYQQNLEKGIVDGFTIQVYSGTKREDALNIRKKLTQSLPDLQSDVQYRQPNFRVLSGKYFTRLEAQQDYLSVKRYFPNAIVIPDRIPLN
jgi:hypothetical protein